MNEDWNDGVHIKTWLDSGRTVFVFIIKFSQQSPKWKTFALSCALSLFFWSALITSNNNGISSNSSWKAWTLVPTPNLSLSKKVYAKLSSGSEHVIHISCARCVAHPNRPAVPLGSGSRQRSSEKLVRQSETWIFMKINDRASDMNNAEQKKPTSIHWTASRVSRYI